LCALHTESSLGRRANDHDAKKRDKVQRKPKGEAKFKNAPWFRQKVANFYRPKQKAGDFLPSNERAMHKAFLGAKFTLGNPSPHNIVA
jgi:hypothetical protein